MAPRTSGVKENARAPACGRSLGAAGAGPFVTRSPAPRSPGGGNRFSSRLLETASPRFSVTMGDPSKQDILAIFKRLRSVPTNKVNGCKRAQDPAARWTPVWPRLWEEPLGL